uniref:EIF-4F 25 kDa subunit n=1 Tax=Syphacia muris TaxID=451379 RepID=A0A0N5AMR8_9BILA
MPQSIECEARALKYRWKLWLYHNDVVATTTERFTILASFDTMSEFWRIFQDFRLIAHCNDCQYWLFKDGYSPSRHHPSNKNGGRWIIDLKSSEIKLLFNFYQLKLLFSLIMGRFEAYDESICGCKAEARNGGCRVNLSPALFFHSTFSKLSLRKTKFLALWVNNGMDFTAVNQIGDLMKDCLLVTEGKQFYFENHMYSVDRLSRDCRLAKAFEPYSEQLKHSWKLMLGKRLSDSAVGEHVSFAQIAVLNSIQQFWFIFDKIRRPSSLKAGYIYYLLKNNTIPNVSEQNSNAGRWLVEINSDPMIANFSWLILLLALLLNRFEAYSNEIIGGVIEVFVEKFEVSLWTNDSSDASKVLKIGEILRKELGRTADNCSFHYETQKLYSSRKSFIPLNRRVSDKETLKDCWTLYLFTQNESTNWLNCFTTIASFDTLHEFWNLITGLQKPTSGMAYYCFKTSIRPNWDDENNINGGRWAINVSNQEVTTHFYWLALLLALMLGRFGKLQDNICGAVLRVKRKKCKVSLWIRKITDEMLSQIGEIMRRELSIFSDRKLYYEKHENARTRSDSLKRQSASTATDIQPLQ